MVTQRMVTGYTLPMCLGMVSISLHEKDSLSMNASSMNELGELDESLLNTLFFSLFLKTNLFFSNCLLHVLIIFAYLARTLWQNASRLRFA